ncbi:uncharacterized protein C11orf16 homolog [Epinephelus fuscoguttatus]|uniref:uncharacterized protein C11orf16 homolog n=1 Tax=Epinephelus fuscoguttatus TaxID=293821 RepID=UPI0020D0C35D|nr:uncharacterized protein C11orf16 homolog [Epinephelus fuscoguttatus]XP_049430796.1 uncharacterized protein C11orf16 homolog [Epinephelus fuscoguttatus]
MTSRRTAACQAALLPVFVGKLRCNVTFVVESSEKMRAALGSVKRLLIQTLLMKASLRDSLFNILTFSEKVTSWSHHMLPCAPDTVYTSLSWIHSISCGPGRDLLAALSVALSDSACHCVHLLCTDLPDQPQAVLAALPVLSAGRPVNVFYLQDSGVHLDRHTSDYLQCLSRATRGSCYMIPVGVSGVLEKVFPVVESESSEPVRCLCSLNLHSMSSPLLRCSLGNPYMLSGQTLGAPEFFPGCRVLARREVDGFYYVGTVIQEVQGRGGGGGGGGGGVWVVEFDHPGGAGLGVVSSQKQLVCSLDMLNLSKRHTRCLVPGDAVLSPWEPDLRRYGPGRVMAAAQRRDGLGVDGLGSVQVLMWNSCVSLVPCSLVSSISSPQHDRIVRELHVMTLASGRGSSWLCARSSSSSSCCQPSSCCSVSNLPPCFCPPSCASSSGGQDGPERTEGDKQLDLKDTDVRRSDPEVPSSSSSSSSSLCEGGSRAVKLRSKQQRPPWRYWRRTGPEPQHTQPGSTAQRRPPQPARFPFPVPQISASPNHSSLFQSLPAAKGRRADIRDVLGTSSFKPRPPAGLRPFSGDAAVYT